ncbi:unnamed protein product [Rotaria magnacalcarata]|uniref:G-protein coupled receptors family 1 profile domain-containing protein n=1 Tax=Rotaria magnacalcarata TaxID=392030 RepID=A0A816ZIN1_9BILA|nr:unnamed protein product [Rotaria magnacalcarata]CAF2215886.1 unnamed protein product [Rotaria magnacalcarata]
MADAPLIFAEEMTRISIPMIIFLSVLGNGLNIVILTRSAFTHHASSLYFLVMAINNLFYSTVLPVINLLSDRYNISPSEHSNIVCKLISYLLNLCPNISVYLIVFASVDRFCASSSNAQRRKFSSLRIARLVIILLISLLTLLYLSTLTTFDLRQSDELGCVPHIDTVFQQTLMIMGEVMFAIIAPFMMIVFDLLTIDNVNQLQIIPAVAIHRRTEIQLMRMLLLQLVVHLILILPFCSVFLILSLPIEIRFTSLFDFLFIIFQLPFYLSFVTPFFIYILSGLIYRNELIRLLRITFHVPCSGRVDIMINTILPTQ